MKKMFVLSMLISFAMICSCQKQDSTAEQQLAQRKTDLDAREEALAERKSALDEREKALDEREKALAEKEKATMNARTNPTNVQGQTPDPAQVEAEKDRMIQQLSGMTPDPSQVDLEKAEKEREVQEQLAPSQRGVDLSGAAVSPAAEAAAPTPSPAP